MIKKRVNTNIMCLTEFVYEYIINYVMTKEYIYIM